MLIIKHNKNFTSFRFKSLTFVLTDKNVITIYDLLSNCRTKFLGERKKMKGCLCE